jgi:DNA (cytosine-5)-methyltransferase 1
MRDNDPRSQHVWTFLKTVAELQPQAFVMENVKSLAVNPRWQALMGSLHTFAEQVAGYSTRVWVLNASHYGVPQGRERMFMVGIRNGELHKPRPSSADRPPTTRQALANHPAFGRPGNDSLCTALVTPARNPVLRRSPYAGMLFNGKGRALNLDAPASTLPATMGGNRTPIIDQLELEGRAEENWVVGYHRRLTAGRKPVLKVPKRMRRLTVEEAAVLQTFPSSWRFVGRQSSRYRQIGNAVPPLLARAVAEQLAEDLASAEVESRPRPLLAAA